MWKFLSSPDAGNLHLTSGDLCDPAGLSYNLPTFFAWEPNVARLSLDLNLSWKGRGQIKRLIDWFKQQQDNCVHVTTHLRLGRSRALVVISVDSGHNFSTSSRGPQIDLLWPINDFFAGKIQKGKGQWTWSGGWLFAWKFMARNNALYFFTVMSYLSTHVLDSSPEQQKTAAVEGTQSPKFCPDSERIGLIL